MAKIIFSLVTFSAAFILLASSSSALAIEARKGNYGQIASVVDNDNFCFFLPPVAGNGKHLIFFFRFMIQIPRLR